MQKREAVPRLFLHKYGTCHLLRKYTLRIKFLININKLQCILKSNSVFQELKIKYLFLVTFYENKIY